MLTRPNLFSSISVVNLAKYYSSDQINRNEKRRHLHTEFWPGNLKETDHLKDLGVDGRRILKRIFTNRIRVSVDWIDLAQDRNN
jgi:hypothetical protein